MGKFLDYLRNSKKPLITLGCLLASVMGTVGLAHAVQTDFGKIKVESGSIETTLFDGTSAKVNIGYKLYTPAGLGAGEKAPAALCLHGYQNDHETSAAYAIELARRGYVALAIDEYGHGSTNAGMIDRGYTNHKVTTNYGWDEDGKTYLEIKGQTRYKVMMNFSNLDFFINKYSSSYDFDKGAMIPTESVRDASMGGSAAYAWLAGLPNVDSTRMVVTGHSMGTWASWSVSAAYSGVTLDGKLIEPRATAFQCGELFKTTRDTVGRLAYITDEGTPREIHWNNPLLITAKYDEFNYFRDYAKTPVTKEMIKDEQSLNFLNIGADEAEWNKTFHEDFVAGTSVRREYVVTNHRLTTHDHRAVAAVVNWFNKATANPTTMADTNQIFMIKEVLVFVAMLCGIASAVAMIMCMKEVPFFKTVFAGVPNRPEKLKTGWKFWKGALLTIAISGLTYPFLTQLGHGLMPLPEQVFKMTIGNGFLVWYLFLILVMLCFTLIPYFINKKKGKPTADMVDLGFAREKAPEEETTAAVSEIEGKKRTTKFDWALLGKSALLVLIGAAWMYLQVLLCTKVFQLDFRFIWPFFKTFSWSRLGQFFVYLPVFAVFFVLNNCRIFACNRVKGVDEPGFKGFIQCWWKYALCMVGGILFLCLLEYIPFFLQLGPGADLLFSSTFGGPFMSLLIVFAPQVIVFSVVCTFLYRKTGNAFVGALLVAVLACWIVTGGSAMLFA